MRNKLDEEYADPVKELTSQIDSGLTAEEYIDFDAETCTTTNVIDSE